MFPLLKIIDYLFRKRKNSIGNETLNSFFDNGISFPQFVAIAFDVDDIPEINKYPETLQHKKLNNDIALQFVFHHNEDIAKSNPNYNSDEDKTNLLALILTKQCFKINVQDIIDKCNLIVNKRDINFNSQKELISERCILALLDALTHRTLQYDSEGKTFDELMITVFEKAKVPLVIDKTSLEDKNNFTFLIQIMIILDFFSQKNETEKSDAKNETDKSDTKNETDKSDTKNETNFINQKIFFEKETKENENFASAQKVASIIFEFAEKYDKNIKKQVILIGLSQSGKTTLVNSFLGASYKINPDGSIGSTNPSFDGGGKTGDVSGGSCTMFPTIYDIDKSDFFCLDGPGHGDTRDSYEVNENTILNASEIQVVGSILMEMAVRKAETVSAALILDYQKFSNGIKDLQENGEMIRRLFKNEDNNLPICIVFNRYHSNYMPDMIQSYQLKGKEKLDFIYPKIKEKAQLINESKMDQADIEYFNIIYKNIKNDNFCYIDIEDNEIIEIVKKKFKELPTFSKEKLYFDNSSQIRVKFDRLCRNKLIQFTRILKQSRVKLMYPFDFLNEIINGINKASSQIQKKSLDSLKNEEKEIKEKMDKLEKQINESTKKKENYEKNINETKNKIAILENNQKALSLSIQKIENEISAQEQNNQEKLKLLETESKQCLNTINDKNKKIQELSNSLREFENKDNVPVDHKVIYKEDKLSSVTCYYESNILHDPSFTHVELKMPRIKQYIERDDHNSCRIKFTKEASFRHPHPEIKVEVFLYAKKKDSPRYEKEYSKMKAENDKCHNEIKEANDRLSEIQKELLHCKNGIDDSITKLKNEKEQKENMLNSVLNELKKSNLSLKQEVDLLLNENSVFQNAQNEMNKCRTSIQELSFKQKKNKEDNLKLINYLQKIQLDITEISHKISLLNNRINNFPDDIKPIITISEKLETNEDVLAKIQELNHVVPPAFSFKWVIKDEIPEKIIFIDQASNKEISYDDFYNKLINDIKSVT